jgi:aminoglycoside phosphotransferase (APT) family kinase protein
MGGIAESRDTEAAMNDSLVERLGRLIESECGVGSRVANLTTMEDGHAGLTFGFDVLGVAGQKLGSYVLKLAPPGVTRRGNTDVYRQAPLLRALNAAGLPVPAVPWASADGGVLGTAFIVMKRLPGRVFLVWEPHSSFLRDPIEARHVWFQAARMLARLHRVDWQTSLPDWEKPRPLSEELDFWTPLLRHAQEPEWLVAGSELRSLLAAHLPDGYPIGIVHGDFQPGNILYADGRAGGLIDWELASIGSQGLDVGWLLMMSDSRAWDPAWQPVAPVSREELVEAYREAGGPALLHIDWYQALASYRLGAIACLNVKLHRTGKRTDILWERFAPSISSLFARGIELAGRAAVDHRHGGTLDRL